jgi:hypothetical protein
VRADIDSVLPERSYGRLIVGSHHGLACRCTTEKVIEYHVDAQHKRIQPNLSLQLMIPKSGVFRCVGGFVAQSSKYICYDNEDLCDKGDLTLRWDGVRPLFPLDLVTSSLSPLIAHLK